jgi:hypothetical protein
MRAPLQPRRYACVQPGAAGVSQPWFRKRACNSNTAIVAQGRPADRPYTIVHTRIRTATQERRCRPANNPLVRYHTHGGLTPAALCGRAFVHRKNRFFAGKRSHCNTRAGGVSPPWLRDRDCNDVHQPIGDSLPRLSGIALASAFPHTTAGLRPPLFVGVRLCIAKIVFSPANIRTPTQERGVSPAWRT